jgi:hypothetical protein
VGLCFHTGYGDLVPNIQRSGEFKARTRGWMIRTDRIRALGRTGNGRIVILTRRSTDTPGAVQALVERTAIQDGPAVTVGIFSEPAQAGVDQSGARPSAREGA